jgi:transposase InsO family protein
VARNVTMEEWGFLSPGQYLIHDRDTKFCPAFQQLIDDAGVERVVLPPRSPNLNAYAERWVHSVKEECLSRLILFGEVSLRHALQPTFKGSECPDRFFVLRVLYTTRSQDRVRHRPAGDGGRHQRAA